jgi:hypothetical protein
MSVTIEIFKDVFKEELSKFDPTTLEYIESILADKDMKEDDLLDSLVPLVSGAIDSDEDAVTNSLKKMFVSVNGNCNVHIIQTDLLTEK